MDIEKGIKESKEAVKDHERHRYSTSPRQGRKPPLFGPTGGCLSLAIGLIGGLGFAAYESHGLVAEKVSTITETQQNLDANRLGTVIGAVAIAVPNNHITSPSSAYPDMTVTLLQPVGTLPVIE